MRYKHILVASAVAMFETIPESCEVSTRQEQSAFANAFSIFSDSRFPTQGGRRLAACSAVARLVVATVSCYAVSASLSSAWAVS